MQKLNKRVICPSCWHAFSPSETLWVSAHPDLIGDDRLGLDYPKRFLPDRFDAAGLAIDLYGTSCQELACPECHLLIPRSSLELQPFFISIAGTPSCGKSYFLASMTWKSRQVLPASFSASFTDADSLWNKLLNHYEEQQFFNPESDEIVKLAKTEEQGDLYSVVNRKNVTYTYPKPFMFDLRPLSSHPNAELASKVSRQICVYDNAGESFQPGKDTVTNAVTKHLGRANCWMFCFDPNQDPTFRAAAKKVGNVSERIDSSVTARQETVLSEMVKRIRRQKQMGENETSATPLLIVCTKFDAWWELIGERRLPSPVVASSQSGLKALDLNVIEKYSTLVRDMLFRFSPELVTTAESFSKSVSFIPVSATGISPTQDPVTGVTGVRPKDTRPMWCEVPMLVAMCHRAGLVPYKKPTTS